MSGPIYMPIGMKRGGQFTLDSKIMTLSCSLLCTKGRGYSLAGQLTLSVPLFTTRPPHCSSVTAHSQSKAIRPCRPPCGICVCVERTWSTNDIAYTLRMNWNEFVCRKCTLLYVLYVPMPRSHSVQCPATCSLWVLRPGNLHSAKLFHCTVYEAAFCSCVYNTFYTHWPTN